MLSDSTSLLISLFETVPRVMVCVKSADGRYVAANEAFVLRASRRHVNEVIGRKAADLFPVELAASYEAQDRSLLATGRPARNQLEVITDASGHSGWYLTTKVLTNAVVGAPEVVAVSVEADLARGGAVRAGGVRAAVELVRREYARSLPVAELATAAAMSTDQLERAMRRVLGVSPKQYVVRTRIDQAAFLLVTGSTPIAEVAASCGFFDQSQLTRQFKAAVGLTPGRYRDLARTEPPGVEPSAVGPR